MKKVDFMMHKCGSKVAVVGAGFVGATAAYAMMIQGVTNELAIIDVNKDKAEGEAMDLRDGLQFTSGAKIQYGSDYSLCKGADVVVITAGAHQKPGQTRMDLIKTNAAIFKQIIPQVAKHAPDAVLLIVTNPVDVMTYLAIKYSKFPRHRVFGTGTTLDTARLRALLADKFNFSPSSVHAYILGEHGDSEFPVWSTANVGGVKLADLPGCNKAQLDQCFEKTRKAAYEIIAKKGATYYAIGLTISDIVKAILHDKNEVLPVSTLLTTNYYGAKDVCLSTPCVVGSGGIKHHLHPILDKQEQAALKKSAQAIKEGIKQANNV